MSIEKIPILLPQDHYNINFSDQKGGRIIFDNATSTTISGFLIINPKENFILIKIEEVEE